MGELTVSAVVDAFAADRPDAVAIVDGGRSRTWGELAERSRRLASWLHGQGLGLRRERGGLAPWESGQDQLGLCLHNGTAYVEALLGAWRARIAPFNLDYRYVVPELHALLVDAGATAVVAHAAYAPAVAEASVGTAVRVVLQVPDDSDVPLVPGAVWLDDALAAGDAAGPPVEGHPDDLCILYTGGTTGRPRGVLWRQGDALVACFGVPRVAATPADVVAAATARVRLLPTPPFIHGAGQWVALRTLLGGGVVVVPDGAARFDPTAVWASVARERVSSLAVVGDAFVGPLLDELDRCAHDTSSLTVVLSGGAPLTPRVAAELLERLPTVLVVDGLGSSEVGGQVTRLATRGTAPGPFSPNLVTAVLSADRRRVLLPGDDELGWLASAGHLALGYLGDPDRTARTFPVVDGVRYGVPGDRAVLRADGTIDVRGRESMTINTGGEKVFAEEVEEALKAHPDVGDCVVVGRPSARWGEEIVAIVQLRGRAQADAEVLRAAVHPRLARFKVPKAIVLVDEVRRSAAGKVDYRWARVVAASAVTAGDDRAERVEVERVLEVP